MNFTVLKQICLASIGVLFNLQPNGAIEGKLITCACTSHDCQVSQNVSICVTYSLCYTQLFDRRHGGAVLDRGCIDTKTPLLCENKPPAVPGHRWPLLFCCNFSMCNRNAVPTIPPWYNNDRLSNISNVLDNVTTKSIINNYENTIGTLPQLLEDMTMDIGHQIQNDISTTTSDYPPNRILSPVYMTVLALGVVILVLIGVVAACILRRQRLFYTRHWANIDHGYFKGRPCLTPSPVDIIKVGGGGGLMNVVTTEEDDDEILGRSIAPGVYLPASMLIPQSFSPVVANHKDNNYVPQSKIIM